MARTLYLGPCLDTGRGWGSAHHERRRNQEQSRSLILESRENRRKTYASMKLEPCQFVGELAHYVTYCLPQGTGPDA